MYFPHFSLSLLSFFLFSSFVFGTQDSLPCSGVPNMHPVYDQPPVLVNSSTNGKLFLAGGEQVEPKIYLAHVYGTPYQMGYALGELLGPQLHSIIQETLEWVESVPYHIFPAPIQNYIIKHSVTAALDLTYELTKPYTPHYFYEEMQGMADSSGVDFRNILRVNMIPELIQASCSMFGAWGPAIRNTRGSLFQLRALDWNMNGPFQKAPIMTVYHPISSPGNGGHAFANIGFLGLIGSITGYSSAPVGICEKVWIGYNGTQDRAGYPWHFLLRDILQFDIDIDQALSRIANAHRTCAIYVGVGDGETSTFRAIEYSHDYIEIYNDHNYPTDGYHPLMNGLVYIDKHVQPSSDPCFPSLLQYYYGNIDPLVTRQNITAQFQTGTTQVAIYDFERNEVFVSYAGVWNPNTHSAEFAYDRQYTLFDMKSIFTEPHP